MASQLTHANARECGKFSWAYRFSGNTARMPLIATMSCLAGSGNVLPGA
jgi:hypothetical protein